MQSKYFESLTYPPNLLVFAYFSLNTSFTIFSDFRKGFDSGREGKAEMGEWPWHVSLFSQMIND